VTDVTINQTTISTNVEQTSVDLQLLTNEVNVEINSDILEVTISPITTELTVNQTTVNAEIQTNQVISTIIGIPGPAGPAGSGSVGTTVNKEVPTGDIDGVNAIFILANTPLTGTDYVFRNGIEQAGGGADYTLTGATIFFTFAPDIGDTMYVTYQHL
jgi:hypothetical protein